MSGSEVAHLHRCECSLCTARSAVDAVQKLQLDLSARQKALIRFESALRAHGEHQAADQMSRHAQQGALSQHAPRLSLSGKPIQTLETFLCRANGVVAHWSGCSFIRGLPNFFF